MTLCAAVTIQRDGFRLDVGIDVADGEVLAVVGPNGAGKSTALRGLAGLPVTGADVHDVSVRIDGHDWSAEPTERRPIGVVFQDLRLFPHLDAVDNVAFSLRARGTSTALARERAAEELRCLGLPEDRHGARPGRLSGGEAQRVAIARALVAGPRLLLLDEPFAAIDAAARSEARAVLQRRLAGFGGSAVLVTHDPADALLVCDRVLVLEDGQVSQAGAVQEVARRPRTRYAAELVGTNLLLGVSDGTTVRTSGGLRVVAADVVADGPVGVVVPPAAVALHDSEPTGTPRNVWAGEVTAVELLGSRARVAVDLGGEELIAEVTVTSVDALGLRPGRSVWASVKATEVTADRGAQT